MNIEEIDKWLDNEYGVSYTRLEEIHDFLVEQNMKYQDKIESLQQENKQLKEQLEYLRSNKYLNQVKWERNFNEELVKDLQQENKQLKETIEQIRKMLYKRHLDDYDLYTANVLCDMQSEFEEILRGE